ncbi:far upstream element-binding protein 2 isoform X1 [Dendrobium catenatum]|uniref:K Homology domain-containing protein n=1 Tax=Dendrobium catenatum TaxID=906689 RepID=A0A2I0VB82_9ASPA|nr:far upstream element-binding protein 2 isoform X1 [Dendrobium catenatum]PKU60671.1 hypothetical protein MA16_Dca020444 [Dendrobium catenatum]
MAEEEPLAVAEPVGSEGEGASLPVKEIVAEGTERSEEGTPEAAVEAAETQVASDNKRKLDDLEPLENYEAPAKKQQIDIAEPTSESSVPAEDQGTVASDEASREIGAQETDGSGYPTTEKNVAVADSTTSDSAHGITAVDGNVEEHSGQNEEIGGEGLRQAMMEKEPLGNGQISSTSNIEHAYIDDAQNASLAPQQDGFPHDMHQIPYDLSSSSRKIEVPNNKVGILIGKSGETIRFLQLNSGASIQITKDADVGQLSSTRPVELTGTPENINKAEQLIKNVIAEADAGGSPSLVARGFSTSQPDSEQIEIQIPNGKVGVIIGKGGGTIKNMQTKTGARIQLIPQHLPEGDSSRERTVRITGNKKQIESAKELIKDVINQPPVRQSSHSSTTHPPHGPAPVTQWSHTPTAPAQQTVGYSHQQIGMYPPQTTQYPQTYNSYTQEPPTRGAYGSSWDQQRPPAGPMQSTPQQPGGYDYYNQGGFVRNNQPPNPLPGSVPASTPAPMNYNYAQSQSSDVYGNSAPFTQPPPAQQKYGYGYNEPTYDNQPPGPQMYGQQQSIGSQPGMYGQQSSIPYGKPAYSELPPSYAPAPARPSQPEELMYQGAPPAQQPYPYTSNAPTQQAPYTQTYATANGYSQQPPPSGGYPQQHAPVYGQGGQAVPAPYGQSVPQSSGYSQYPSSSQPSYDQTAQSNVNYGYQGATTDAAYIGNAPNSGYAAQQPISNQLGYSQPPANPSGYYDQSMPQQPGGYAVPGAPVGYAKSVSPQPGYGGQYDSAQIYGQH